MPIPLGSRPDDRCSSSRSANSSPGRTLIRKTSLLRIVPTACGQAADIASHAILPDDDFHRRTARSRSTLGDCEAVATLSSRSQLGAILPLHDVRDHARALMAYGLSIRVRNLFLCERASRLVEPDGIEPTTSCLQSRRSPN